ncbi:MAG: hypothetical protein ABR985_05975 [Methanotrichaceae archaeon]|jgi:hypothetical protein
MRICLAESKRGPRGWRGGAGPNHIKDKRRGSAVGVGEAKEAWGQEHDGSAEGDGRIVEVTCQGINQIILILTYLQEKSTIL